VRVIDSIAQSLFSFLLAIIFINIALQALISMFLRFLPQIIGLGLITIGMTALVTVGRQSFRRRRPPLLPPDTPSLSSHKQRRARSTGGSS